MADLATDLKAALGVAVDRQRAVLQSSPVALRIDVKMKGGNIDKIIIWPEFEYYVRNHVPDITRYS